MSPGTHNDQINVVRLRITCNLCFQGANHVSKHHPGEMCCTTGFHFTETLLYFFFALFQEVDIKYIAMGYGRDTAHGCYIDNIQNMNLPPASLNYHNRKLKSFLSGCGKIAWDNYFFHSSM